jgi:hypothetical protein
VFQPVSTDSTTSCCVSLGYHIGLISLQLTEGFTETSVKFFVCICIQSIFNIYGSISPNSKPTFLRLVNENEKQPMILEDTSDGLHNMLVIILASVARETCVIFNNSRTCTTRE